MAAGDKKSHNSREFFRVSYRRSPGPVFVIGKVKYPILDISEGGLKFGVKKGQGNFFSENDTIMGRLIFPQERGTYDLTGVIIRVTDHEVALQLPNGGRIPLSKIMEEQRILIKLGRM